MSDHLVPGRARVLFAVLAVAHLFVGVWALVTPRGFYDDFPGVGPALVGAEPPFNMHLASDAGGGFAAVGAALVVAALARRRWAALVALVAALVLDLPHAIFHLAHPAERLSTVATVVNNVVLAVGVLLVVLATVWTFGGSRAPASSTPSTTSTTSTPRPVRTPRTGARFRGLHALVSYTRAFAGAKRHRTDFVGWLGRRPQLLLANGVYETAVMFSNRCEPRLKMLAELKTAAIVNCEFCLDIGSALVRYSDVTERQLVELPRFRDSDAYTDVEKLVLELAEAMTRVPTLVPDELREALLTHLTRGQYAELAATIAWENQRSRVNQALGVRATGMADGLVCAVPEPAAP